MAKRQITEKVITIGWDFRFTFQRIIRSNHININKPQAILTRSYKSIIFTPSYLFFEVSSSLSSGDLGGGGTATGSKSHADSPAFYRSCRRSYSPDSLPGYPQKRDTENRAIIHPHRGPLPGREREKKESRRFPLLWFRFLIGTFRNDGQGVIAVTEKMPVSQAVIARVVLSPPVAISFLFSG